MIVSILGMSLFGICIIETILVHSTDSTYMYYVLHVDVITCMGIQCDSALLIVKDYTKRHDIGGQRASDMHTLSRLSFLSNALSIQSQGLVQGGVEGCLLYTSPSPRDATLSRMPSSA